MFNVNFDGSQISLKVCFKHGVDVKADKKSTECRIFDRRTNQLIATGVALCSNKDAFSKPKGRMLSFERALRDVFGSHRGLRRVMWQHFWESPDGNRIPHS